VAKTLLAVDDSATMRKVLEITFSGEDFRVITASNTQSALGQLAENPGVFVVDSVLGDDDGYALTKELRRRHPGAAIVMLASRYAPYDAARGHDAGADDSLDKPFDTQQLIDKVRKAVALREAGPAIAPPKAPPSAPRLPPPAPSAPSLPQSAASPAAPPFRAPSPPQPPPYVPPAGAPLGPQATAQHVFGNAAPSPRGGTQVVPGPPPPPQTPRGGTLVFGESPLAGLGVLPRPAARPEPPPPVVAAPPPAAPVASAASPASVGAAIDVQLAAKFGELGLTPQQAEAVFALSRQVVERIVWEVVPQLAETMIKEEIQRLLQE
jgi:CheY-like chemotaxis protein